jgi:hypothetical protein
MITPCTKQTSDKMADFLPMTKKVEFSEYEQLVISWYVSKVEALIITRAPNLVEQNYVWKIRRPITDNCHSMQADTIYITPTIMQIMVEGYKFQDSNKISSVFHFLFKGYLRDWLSKHLDSQELQKVYDKYWGYTVKPIKDVSGTIRPGYIVNLKFHGNQREYHPTLQNSATGLKPVLIELNSRTGSCYEMTKIVRAIESAECLIQRFNGLYAPTSGTAGTNNTRFLEIVDPNKILVTLISEYVVGNYRFIGNNPASPDIYEFINKIIGNDCLANLGQNAYPLS